MGIFNFNNELIVVNKTPDPTVIRFDLPDPEQDSLNVFEFLEKLNEAWAVCDRFDLQTDIWRGRILKVVRDREKKGGEGRGAGFLQWLRERDISKSRAYGLIQLADSAEQLLGEGMLEEESVNLFSKNAFLETARAQPEVQQMISDAANEGQEITKRQVKRLTDEFTASTSPILPEEIRAKTQQNLLPSKIVAPLAKELSKLPDIQQKHLCSALRENHHIESIKDVTATARWISKTFESSQAVRAFQISKLDLERALKEADRIEVLGLLADAFSQAQQIESSTIRFHNAWLKLGDLHQRLWEKTGSSTPSLREVLSVLETLSGSKMRIHLGEISGGKKLRIQIVEESADHLGPPKII